MPEIDTELFQVIVLGGLALLLILSLLALNGVSKLKKTVAEGSHSKADDAQHHWEQPAPEQQPLQAQPSAGYSEPWNQPAAAQPAPAETFEMPVAQPAADAIPEEQPFERDGRWWFKRGDELLVYDEQTGQWQPAPANAAMTIGGGSRPAAQPSFGTGQAGEGTSGFWKCPSCGAVNGSTSATCRMCFAARP